MKGYRRNMKFSRYLLIVLLAGAFCISTGALAATLRSTNSISLKIAGKEYPLEFAASNLSHEAKQTIADDIELAFSANTSAVLRAESAQWHGYSITHQLVDWKSGEFCQWSRGTLPGIIRESFGLAVTIEGNPHLLIHEALIEAYQEALNLKKKNPAVYGTLDDFVDLLQNPKKLEELANNADELRGMFYFYKKEAPRTDAEYKKLIRSAMREPKFRIQSPSLLDVEAMGKVWKDPTVNDVLLFLARIEFEGERTLEHMWWPLGAYTDGKWRILQRPMP
jgi:hypothetical protein